jgi:hypothetical protein
MLWTLQHGSLFLGFVGQIVRRSGAQEPGRATSGREGLPLALSEIHLRNFNFHQNWTVTIPMPIGCRSGRPNDRRRLLHRTPLAATVITGATLFAAGSEGFWTSLMAGGLGAGLKNSFASTFNVVLGRAPVTLIEPNDLSATGLKFVSITQVFVGLVLLFLFGLGIRNRFRMK